MMLVEYMNCSSSSNNPSSYTTLSGAAISNTTQSECLSASVKLMRMFLIPTVICSVVTILVNPLILFTILLKEKLRKETRYILLANVMISDLIFLLFNTLISTYNAIHWYSPRFVCFILIVFTFAAYSSCVLTFTVMVIDTYIAVCFPLRYYTLLSAALIRKILFGIWIFSAVFSLCFFLLSESFYVDPRETQDFCLMFYYGPNQEHSYLVTVVCSFSIFFLLLCSVMITYFYIKLYKMTRQSGIWVSRFSRARMTLLTHSILLCLYIVPALILDAEVMLFKNSIIGIDIRLWMSASNNGVMMMMPRALSPLLYGLRYREISETLKHWFYRNRVSFIGMEACR